MLRSVYILLISYSNFFKVLDNEAIKSSPLFGINITANFWMHIIDILNL